MDRKLRRLQRLAASDPSVQPQYIAALEKVVGGQDIEGELLDDARIASCVVPREEEINVSRDLDLLNVYKIGDSDGNAAGYMIDVYWEEGFDIESDWGREMVEDIESQLSDFTQKALGEASHAGYTMIIFWK